MPDTTYDGYGVFHTIDEEGKPRISRSVTAGSMDDIITSLADKNLDDVPSGLSSNKDDDVNIRGAVAEGIWHFYNQLKSFYELDFLCDTVPSFFVSSYFKTQIEDYARSNFPIVKVVDGVPVYGLRNVDLIKMNRRLDRWHEIDSGFEKLPPSLLLSLISTYDSAFVDFCRTLLRAKPQRYIGSDRKYSVADILQLGSIEEIIEIVINDELDQVMRKSHADQVDFFEKIFNVSVKDGYERWSDYIEIFERRNLAAHGELKVNEIYRKNLKDLQKDIPGIGTVLTVDGDYLCNSIDVLIEFGVMCAMTAWQKQFPAEASECFDALVEISYSLLYDRHPRVAKTVLQSAIAKSAKGASEEQIKMMTINLAIALKMSGDTESSTRILDRTDWSLCGPHFHLCRHAIQENFKEAASYIKSCQAGGLLSMQSIRDWPAFQWARNNDEFREAAEAAFLEPLSPGKLVVSTENESESAAPHSNPLIETRDLSINNDSRTVEF